MSKPVQQTEHPVPNIIDPGNDISVQDIELMELTHDVAFSQCSDLLQISDDDQPPIKKSTKPKISKDTFNCTDCEVQTSSKFKLNGHQKRKHPTPRTNQRGGGRLDLLTNHLFQDAQPSGSRQAQSQQQQQQQQTEDKEFEDFFNDHPKPWANNDHLKEDYHQHFIRMFGGNPKPWTGDDQLKKVYRRHFDQIKNQDPHRRCTRTYIRFLDEKRYTLLEAMENVIDQVFCHQSQAFKINMSFSYILQNCETGEYRFFYASNNEQLLNIPKLIRNQEDLNKLLDHLASKDYPTFLKQHRPNSKWTIKRIVNLRVILYLVDFPLGRLPKLPAYIKHNRFIIGLDKNAKNSQQYKDNLCFFRCLVIGKFGTTYKDCNRKQKNCSKSIVIISK